MSFSKITSEIYAATLDPNVWESVVEQITSYIGASAGFYAGMDTRSGRGAYWYAVGHSLEIQKIYNEIYIDLDPTLRQIIQNPGVAYAFGQDIFSSSHEYIKFHENFMKPNGLGPVLSAVISRRGSVFSFFGFQRRLGEIDFSNSETDFIQDLLPHFRQADAIAARLAKVSDAKKLLMTALDRIEHALIFIGESGHIQLANRSAEKMLEIGDSVQASFGRLKFSEDNLVIQNKIKEVADKSVQSNFVSSAALKKLNISSIAIFPAESEYSEPRFENKECSVIVIISTISARCSAESYLIKKYKLTPSEVRILSALSNGLRTDELCISFCISQATLKTHLQHIFQKTGVSRQVDLVRIFYESPRINVEP